MSFLLVSLSEGMELWLSAAQMCPAAVPTFSPPGFFPSSCEKCTWWYL